MTNLYSIIQSSYNYLTGTKESYLNDNIKAIVNFPENDPEAKIKSDGGMLINASYGLNWAYGWAKGSVLSGTVKVITDTANKALSHLKSLESNALSELKKGNKLNKVKMRALVDALETDVELVAGMGRIYEVYMNRYRNYNSKKEPLNELKHQFEQKRNDLKQCIDSYEKIINQLQAKKVDLTQSIIKPSIEPKTRHQATSSLSAYCKVYSPGVSQVAAAKMIQRGSVLWKSIMAGDKKNEKPEEQDLADLTWYLMSFAFKKKQGFNEGTFVIEDRNQNLYNYLKSGSYTRSSSHYKGRAENTQRGIDVINGKMPANKRTLLFEMVQNIDGKKVLFLKPENFSADKTKPYDLIMHGYEFGVAQYNKMMRPGSDDLPNMRKERVPVKILREFVSLVNNQEINLEDKNKVKLDAKKFGIAFMKKYVEDNKLKAGKFNQMINGFDNLENRTGREVYLTQKDFQD